MPLASGTGLGFPGLAKDRDGPTFLEASSIAASQGRRKVSAGLSGSAAASGANQGRPGSGESETLQQLGLQHLPWRFPRGLGLRHPVLPGGVCFVTHALARRVEPRSAGGT